MTNSLELLRLADSLDRQGFYRLAQEAEESAQEQAASQQELQENTSNFYGMTGNVFEYYRAYIYILQIKNLIKNSDILQKLIQGVTKINTIDQLNRILMQSGNSSAAQLLNRFKDNSIIASRAQQLANYIQNFRIGSFFTPQEIEIIRNASKFKNIQNSKGIAGILQNSKTFINKFQQISGISDDIIKANPSKFKNVLNLMAKGNFSQAENVLKTIKGLNADQIKAILFNRNSIQGEIQAIRSGTQSAVNALNSNKAAQDAGEKSLKSLTNLASKVPAISKILKFINFGITKGLPILGILGGIGEIASYIKQYDSAAPEDKYEIGFDIAQGLATVIGNGLMLIPVTVPLGTAILTINFVADFMQSGMKQLGYGNLGNGQAGFESEEQMKKTKQIAEQDLSVVSSNPEVTKVMDHIIQKNWVYFADPVRHKNEISQALMPNNALATAGGLFGSDRNANFWKWSGNTNSPEYLEFVQSLTQLKKKLFDSFRPARQMNPRTSCRIKVKLKYA
jgi:hypothetical protein